MLTFFAYDIDATETMEFNVLKSLVQVMFKMYQLYILYFSWKQSKCNIIIVNIIGDTDKNTFQFDISIYTEIK